jgi:hypothetical protein
VHVLRGMRTVWDPRQSTYPGDHGKLQSSNRSNERQSILPIRPIRHAQVNDLLEVESRIRRFLFGRPPATERQVRAGQTIWNFDMSGDLVLEILRSKVVEREEESENDCGSDKHLQNANSLGGEERHEGRWTSMKSGGGRGLV